MRTNIDQNMYLQKAFEQYKVFEGSLRREEIGDEVPVVSDHKLIERLSSKRASMHCISCKLLQKLLRDCSREVQVSLLNSVAWQSMCKVLSKALHRLVLIQWTDPPACKIQSNCSLQLCGCTTNTRVSYSKTLLISEEENDSIKQLYIKIMNNEDEMLTTTYSEVTITFSLSFVVPFFYVFPVPFLFSSFVLSISQPQNHVTRFISPKLFV